MLLRRYHCRLWKCFWCPTAFYCLAKNSEILKYLTDPLFFFLLSCLKMFRRHWFHVGEKKAGMFPSVWDFSAWSKRCRQHFYAITAVGKRRNEYKVPHVPLSVVLTFQSPHRPSTIAGSGAQKPGWRQGTNQRKALWWQSKYISRGITSSTLFFLNISFHTEVQYVMPHIENGLCKKKKERKKVLEKSQVLRRCVVV